jgi:predicted RNA-binding protein with RPS1 domain
MTLNKNKDEEIEEKILEILERERIYLSIKKIKELLNKKYSINISPQITKRYLFKLKKEGKII